MMPGELFNVPTPSQMGSTLQQLTVWARKASWSFGGALLSAILSAKFSLKQASTKEEVVIASVDLGKNKKIQEGWGFLTESTPRHLSKTHQGKKKGAEDE